MKVLSYECLWAQNFGQFIYFAEALDPEFMKLTSQLHKSGLLWSAENLHGTNNRDRVFQETTNIKAKITYAGKIEIRLVV